ncbi:MAG: RNA methyltransferase [Pseudomonadota bacterium]|nr:RNA methyltransferase [Pseudomonadota bacterium]
MNRKIRFVLCDTTHPGNIGAAARSLKTMGFDQLALVRPRFFPDPEADARATGAIDVLKKTLVTGSLSDAVADCGLVVATSARTRKFNNQELDPRAAALEILAASENTTVAVVFGTESSGLSNAQIDLCQKLIYIPTNPDYSSLNLASAVQLIAYELHYADAIFRPARKPEYPPATNRQMEDFYNHLSDALISSGFINPNNPGQLMRRLRLIFNRAELDEHELNILRGVLSSISVNKNT